MIDARAFGRPQRRKRVYLLASREEDPAPRLFAGSVPPPAPTDHHGKACGFYWTEGVRGLGWAISATPTIKGGSTVGIPSPPAIWMPDGTIVTPDIRDAERLQGFRANWTKPAEEVRRRGFRWKLVGNAVSVPVAKWIGDRLADPAPNRPWGPPRGTVNGSWPKAAVLGATRGSRVLPTPGDPPPWWPPFLGGYSRISRQPQGVGTKADVVWEARVKELIVSGRMREAQALAAEVLHGDDSFITWRRLLWEVEEERRREAMKEAAREVMRERQEAGSSVADDRPITVKEAAEEFGINWKTLENRLRPTNRGAIEPVDHKAKYRTARYRLGDILPIIEGIKREEAR